MSFITWHGSSASPNSRTSRRAIAPGWAYLGAALVSLMIWTGLFELVVHAI